MLAERITASQLAEMSAQGASLSERLRPEDLHRLSGIVATGASVQVAPLSVTVRFGIGPEDLPVIRVQVSGALSLVCQRCMSPVGYPLDVDVWLTVVGTDAAAAELADPFDSVVLDKGELALRVAVEDEILAALPLVPLHADAADCGAGAGGKVAATRRVNRPFADLAALMEQRRSGKDEE